MNKDFTINGRSFEKTISDLELMMDEFHDEQYGVLMSARDFMEWLQEETEKKIDTKMDCLGNTIINITSEDVQWIVTPNGSYQFMDGDLIKVSE